MSIIVNQVGTPFGGKGVVSNYLCETRGFIHFSTSDALRRFGDDETKKRLKLGLVAFDEVMIPILEKHLPRRDRIIIDSLRSQAQIRWLQQNRPDAELHVIHLHVSDEEAFKRLENAQNTERGKRDDDDQLPVRLIEYNRYSKEMQPILEEFGRRYIFIDTTGRTPQQVFDFVDQYCRIHRIFKPFAVRL